jgi:hypothetical protein
MKIIPYIGTENIKFGYSIQECINILGNEYQKKAKVVDFIDEFIFPKYGILLSFENSELSYIGFLKNVDLSFDNHKLFKLDLREIKRYLNCNGTCLEDESSIISKKIGLSFFFSNKSDISFPDEISIFKNGYYSEMEENFKIL